MRSFFLQKLPLIFILLQLSKVHAQTCVYFVDKKDVTITWTAFKTNKKAGVSGTFPDFTIRYQKDNTSIEGLLTNAFVEINSLKVSSGMKIRDEKISKFFFSTTKNNGKILGTISKFLPNEKMAILNLELNGVPQKVPLDAVFTKNEIKLSGQINILAFGMSGELQALNKACQALHEGNTWADANIEITAKYTSSCK